ncbi:hypothetical protein [Streptomyces globisporus]|uniref:hypothetical protein n=1 Tax=Streptomyces globisporus TaxID=1908 RepID=UPI0034608A1E|nr:hypothetical protein OG425_34030 [Streptomyces globisporus]
MTLHDLQILDIAAQLRHLLLRRPGLRWQLSATDRSNARADLEGTTGHDALAHPEQTQRRSRRAVAVSAARSMWSCRAGSWS